MKRSVERWMLVHTDGTPVSVGCGVPEQVFRYRNEVEALGELRTGERVVRCTVTWDDGKPAPRKRGARRASR